MAYGDQNTFGLPPDFLAMLGGGAPQGAPQSFAPVAGAAPDEAALRQQAYGYTPEADPQQHPLLQMLQTIIGGIGDAQGAKAVALSGNPALGTHNLQDLSALRQRREEMRRQRGATADAYKREGAKAQLDTLEREKQVKEARANRAEDQKLARESAADELRQRQVFEDTQRVAQETFRAEQEQKDRDLRKTIADSENNLRMRVAQIKDPSGAPETPDKVAIRQQAKEQREALTEAKDYALMVRDQIAADPSKAANARAAYQDKMEVHLDGDALTAAMAWFDLKVGPLISGPGPDMTDRPPGIERHVKRTPESDLRPAPVPQDAFRSR